MLKLCSQVVPSLSQSAVPLLHDASEHTPPEHIRLSLTPHAAAHAPQWALVSSGVSQPSLSALLQSPKPGWHATKLHVPMEHDALAPANAQLAPQLPQSVKVDSEVSQPLFASLSQSANPLGHVVTTHSPPTH